MPRRIGFGDREPPQAVEADEDDRASVKSLTGANPTTPTRTPVVARVLGGGFLLLWLAVWSYGISVAASILLDVMRKGETAPMAFLTAWLILAVIGWWFAARALLRVIRGERILPNRRRKGVPAHVAAERDMAGPGDGDGAGGGFGGGPGGGDR